MLGRRSYPGSNYQWSIIGPILYTILAQLYAATLDQSLFWKLFQSTNIVLNIGLLLAQLIWQHWSNQHTLDWHNIHYNIGPIILGSIGPILITILDQSIFWKLFQSTNDGPIIGPTMVPWLDQQWSHNWTNDGPIIGPTMVPWLDQQWSHDWTNNGPIIWTNNGPIIGPTMVP